MFIRTVSGLILLIASFCSWAIDPIYTPWLSNNAIEGYDTVAYHLENKAVKGNKKYQTEWQGADWLFASEENLKLFKNDPEKYAPQYGGYCAYAVSQNTTASIDPTQFSVIDGKLYLNYNEKIQEKWLQQSKTYIDLANKYWPTLNQ